MKVAWIIPVSLLAGLAMAADDELPFLQPTTPYSGVRIIQTSEGELRQIVYWTEEKSRTETELPGMSMTNIVREDLGVMWISNPVMGGCLEQTLDDVDEVSPVGGGLIDPGDVSYEEVGTETIDGVETRKYEVTSTEDAGAQHEATFWVTEDNIVMRMEVEPDDAISQENFTMRMTNLKTGPQPDSLFESPGKCSQMPAIPGMTVPDQ